MSGWHLSVYVFFFPFFIFFFLLRFGVMGFFIPMGGGKSLLDTRSNVIHAVVYMV